MAAAPAGGGPRVAARPEHRIEGAVDDQDRRPEAAQALDEAGAEDLRSAWAPPTGQKPPAMIGSAIRVP